MGGIEPERDEGRRDVAVEVLGELVALGVAQFGPGRQNDALAAQCGDELLQVAGGELGEHRAHGAPDRGQMLARVGRVRARIGFVAPLRLAAQDAHALHEELVEVRGEHGEELEPLE